MGLDNKPHTFNGVARGILTGVPLVLYLKLAKANFVSGANCEEIVKLKFSIDFKRQKRIIIIVRRN